MSAKYQFYNDYPFLYELGYYFHEKEACTHNLIFRSDRFELELFEQAFDHSRKCWKNISLKIKPQLFRVGFCSENNLTLQTPKLTKTKISINGIDFDEWVSVVRSGPEHQFFMSSSREKIENLTTHDFLKYLNLRKEMEKIFEYENRSNK